MSVKRVCVEILTLISAILFALLFVAEASLYWPNQTFYKMLFTHNRSDFDQLVSALKNKLELNSLSLEGFSNFFYENGKWQTRSGEFWPPIYKTVSEEEVASTLHTSKKELKSLHEACLDIGVFDVHRTEGDTGLEQYEFWFYDPMGRTLFYKNSFNLGAGWMGPRCVIFFRPKALNQKSNTLSTEAPEGWSMNMDYNMAGKFERLEK